MTPDAREAGSAPTKAAADEADLQAGIDHLAGLVADSMDLAQLLTEVAASGAQAVPGADGVGLTLVGADRSGGSAIESAATGALIDQLVRLQFADLHEGPCVTAVANAVTVRSGSLGGEKRWPRFGPRAGRLGVNSVLALPLGVAGTVIGVMGVYSHRRNGFDDHAAELAQLFAKPAAVAVHNAHILAQAQTMTAQLQVALTTRPIIDQAIGLLRGRTGRSAEDSFAQLRAISQAEHRKVAEVAQQIVEEAVRRARSRRKA
ncbi:histidine kinase [Mycobacterium sp. djl-10]|nr:histidine kinase [Mycobacterium sp. djl-10]